MGSTWGEPVPTLLSLNPNSPWEPRGLPPLYLLKGAGVGPGGYSRDLARRGLENKGRR